MPAQHIIFDFDGTLIDSSPGILETLGSVLRAHGIEPARPLNRAIIGPPLHATLEICTGIADKGVIEKLATDFRSRYDSDGIYATPAYPEIASVLPQLMRAGTRLHLATNKRERPTLLLLAHFGWKPWFESVYCIDSRKPAYPGKGDMLLVQLAEQKLDRRQCVYVGDTAHDEKAAAHAGLPFVAVGWGYGVGEQTVSTAAQCLRAPSDLLKL